jgi:hypothetical protein
MAFLSAVVILPLYGSLPSGLASIPLLARSNFMTLVELCRVKEKSFSYFIPSTHGSMMECTSSTIVLYVYIDIFLVK